MADGKDNDTALRQVISFTRREGYNGPIAVNLFAYQSPFPQALKQVADLVGPAKDQYLQDAFAQADKVMAGWGAFDALQRRDRAALQLCAKPIYCWEDYPRHPCRLANETPLSAYC